MCSMQSHLASMLEKGSILFSLCLSLLGTETEGKFGMKNEIISVPMPLTNRVKKV